MAKKAASELAVRIGADTSGLKRGLRSAETGLQKLGRIAAKAGKAMVVGLAAATVAVAALTRAGLKHIDAQAKLARSIGGTIDGLRGLQIAASDAGLSVEITSKASERLSQRIGEALRNPLSQSAQAFDRLGLSAEALSKMDVDERLAAVADRTKELGLSAAQTADNLRQLGVRDVELVNLLRQGGDAIRAARREVDEFGLSVSAVDAAKVEAANDAFSRIGRIVEGIRNQLAIRFAPVIKNVADRINQLAKDHGGWGEVAGRVAQSIVDGLIAGARAARTIAIEFWGIAQSLFETTKRALEFFGVIETNEVEALQRRMTQAHREMLKAHAEANDENLKGTHRGINAEERALALGKEILELEGHINDIQAQQILKREAQLAPLTELSTKLREQLGEIREITLGAEGIDGGEGGPIIAALFPEGHFENLAEKLGTTENMIRESQERTVALYEQTKERMLALQASEGSEKASLIAKTGKEIFAINSADSKKQFELNKKFAIAEAGINAGRAIAQVWADSSLNFWAKVGATVVTAAKTHQNIQAIRSTTFGGGTTPSAAGGETVNGNPVGNQNSAPSRTVHVRGINPDDLFSGRQLVELLNEAQRDGSKLVIA